MPGVWLGGFGTAKSKANGQCSQPVNFSPLLQEGNQCFWDFHKCQTNREAFEKPILKKSIGINALLQKFFPKISFIFGFDRYFLL
jgi:hypothetical protein